MKHVLILLLATFSFSSFAHDVSPSDNRSYEDGLTFCSIENAVKQCISFTKGKLIDSDTDKISRYVVSSKKTGFDINSIDGHLLFEIVIEPTFVELVSSGALSNKGRVYFLDQSYGPCYDFPMACM